MLFTQSLDLCFVRAIGGNGMTAADFDAALRDTGKSLERLRAAHAADTMPLLRLPEKRDDLAAITARAEQLSRGASDVVVLATGGSSLGGQALAGLTGWRGPAGDGSGTNLPRLHFMANLDPATLATTLARLDLKATRFLVISKSGNTAETLMQMIAAIEALNTQALGWNLENHFLAISEPTSGNAGNGLRHLCEMHNIPVLDHDPDLGGRYSVLSLVGLLPAVLSGLDAEAIRTGAAQSLAPLLAGAAPGDVPAAAGAALNIAMRGKCGIAVMMAYADRLRKFAGWFCQLWAESLGKDGHGTAPVAALGPLDQHSQLQLFLDGPADKLFTVLTTEVAHTGPVVPAAMAKDRQVGYLAGKSVGDLVDCEQRATIATLTGRGRPVRTIHVETLDEKSLGALFMHFMLETIITGDLLGINVFDQPAVEQGKELARDYLGNM